MRKLYIVGLIVVAALVIGIAIADEIKFSTYYPAPAGMYREFDTTGRTCLATDEYGIEGDNARVGIGTTDPKAKLDITIEDTGTNTVVYPLSVTHYSTGTSGPGFGSGINFRTETWNPAGAHTDFGRIRTYYNTFNASKMTFSTVSGHDIFVDVMTLYNGNVGIGTVSPTTDANPNGDTTGNLDVNDVWLRGANGGTGRWASVAGIPQGAIVMWSGSIATIPSGWALCNGANGTPNLRDRFIVGAGSSYGVGATGGEVSHRLTINEMPSHTHTESYGVAWDPGPGPFIPAYRDSRGVRTFTSNPTGGGQPHENRPPYYALAYIMKI